MSQNRQTHFKNLVVNVSDHFGTCNEGLSDFQVLALFSEVELLEVNCLLTHLIKDYKRFESLVPHYLLVGRNFYCDCLLDDIYEKGMCSRIHWWQVQVLTNYFWKRWLYEYLTYLTCRLKWRTNAFKINISDLAVVEEDNIKRGQWPWIRAVAKWDYSSSYSENLRVIHINLQ